MAEGRKNRSGRRSRSSARDWDRSLSDPEIAQAEGAQPIKPRWNIIDGLTVDELARYRRRRIADHPKDNLGLTPPEEDLANRLVTEYRLSFKGSTEEVFKGHKIVPPKLIDDIEENETVREEVKDQVEETKAAQDYQKDEEKIDGDNESEKEEEEEEEDNKDEQEVEETKENDVEKAKVAVESNDMNSYATQTAPKSYSNFRNTEYSTFVPYPGSHRPQLARRPTSLRMEGEMETRTEKCEAFPGWVGQGFHRPEPIRLQTNLRMEGDFESRTENHEKYVPFIGTRRPELLRRGTQLRLEGESTFAPEYSEVFRGYTVFDRPEPKIPETHLKPGVDLFEKVKASPVAPMIKSNGFLLSDDVKKTEDVDKEMGKSRMLKKEEEMKLLVSKLEELQGPSMGVPEYKDAYKDFPRNRPTMVKPDIDIGKADGSKISSPKHRNRFPLKIDQDPEYKSIHRRPPGPVYPDIDRFSRRSSYSNYDYLHRYDRTNNNSNNSNNTSNIQQNQMIKSNYWVGNDNRERFGRVNAKDDQDSFQMLETKLHNDSVVGKPPPASRRNSRSTVGRASPTFRLHVSHADDEPRGFRNRSYSPSFARHQDYNNPQSFMVLDNDHRFDNKSNNINHNQSSNRSRRRTDRNSNYTIEYVNSPRHRANNKMESGWMPPWYDSSTSTL